MSDINDRDSDRREYKTRELISQDAAEWFARMQDLHVSIDDRRRFWSWLKASQVHVAEYLAIANVNGGLREARLSVRADASAESNVVPLPISKPVTSEPELNVSSVPSWRWKIAAALAVFALASLMFVATQVAWFDRMIATELGEWKTVTLADSSEVRLGPNTRLSVELSDDRRSVELLRGEAYFKVAKDPARPFVVAANKFGVRAVGTEFAVARRNGELIITVAEGIVRVAPLSPRSHERDEDRLELSVPVVADEQLRVSHLWPVTPSRVDVLYELAWKDKRLMFRSGDTLGDAIDEFNLRNRLQLQLDPRAPRAVSVRGSFDASDPKSFARLIDKQPNIRVVAVSADVWRLTAQ
jgi:transmembrane sensor